jgi:hypothetical protein
MTPRKQKNDQQACNKRGATAAHTETDIHVVPDPKIDF